MNGYPAAVSLLPEPLCRPLLRVEPQTADRVQEIRLRAGQALSVCIRGEERYVRADGTLSTERQEGLLCTAELLRATVQRLLQYSAHAHTEELRRGFVTAGGCRVGIAGTAVTANGYVTGYRAIDALCIRVARTHTGCAAAVASALCGDGVHSALLCGEPAAGKTSLLRDLARELMERRLPITVIDERGEIAIGRALDGCDVLRYVPKAAGVEHAVRCLSPRAILLDELGETEEIRAVRDGASRGVPTIATVHGRSLEELCRRRALRTALQDGVFEYLIQLEGRRSPGEIAHIVRTEEWLYERARHFLAGDHGTRVGDDGTAGAQPPCVGADTHRTDAAAIGGTHSLHGGADR